MNAALQPLHWIARQRVPREVQALLAALQFHNRDSSHLSGLNHAGWKRALAFGDRAQLTLLLGQEWGAQLPDEIRQRILANQASKLLHEERLFSALLEILDRVGDRVLVTKGFSHREEYAKDPRLRPQYDIDLYGSLEVLPAARQALIDLGYQPLEDMEGFPTDHLPAMLKKTGWQWRGDFYDPDIPPSVDLHFRLWDESTERFPAPGTENFLERQTSRLVHGRSLPVLDPADELAACSLHLLRHMLRGNLRPYHVYEIAYFLDNSAGDDAFWRRWYDLHPALLRQRQAIVFLLARRWFGCRTAAAVDAEMSAAGEGVHLWMEDYAASPIEGIFRPSKSELWLHLSLLESAASKASVVRRRLLPLGLPGPVDAVFVPSEQRTLSVRVRSAWRYAVHLGQRTVHHLRVMAPLAAEGPRWLLRRGDLQPEFLRFLLAANLYNFGIFVFFLLFNLYLLDLGFREDILGSLAGTMTAGMIAGCVPAAAVARRFGIGKGLLMGAASAPALLASRVVMGPAWTMFASSFLAGIAAAVWFVCCAPAVAQLSSERRRPLAFSLWMGSGIATGILGGLVGSRLPGWVASIGLAVNQAEAKRLAILIGCGLALCSLRPLCRLRLPRQAPPRQRFYSPNRALWRFLGALALWQFAIGSFNPFFNAYFARYLGTSLEQIGGIFAASQLVQAGAILAAPWILRRLGIHGGISTLQASTAAMLALLATSPHGAPAAMVYVAYMSFQVMTEPGLFSLLMNQVPATEQAGASGLNFLVMFSAQAASAWLGGWLAAEVGYPSLLATAAGIGVLAAASFQLLGKTASATNVASTPVRQLP